jgi:hypothetical protein
MVFQNEYPHHQQMALSRGMIGEMGGTEVACLFTKNILA